MVVVQTSFGTGRNGERRSSVFHNMDLCVDCKAARIRGLCGLWDLFQGASCEWGSSRSLL
jgi:hypothetical protein